MSKQRDRQSLADAAREVLRRRRRKRVTLKALGFVDPRRMGASEYAAIYEVLDDVLDQYDEEDAPGAVIAVLEEFVAHATAMKAKVEEYVETERELPLTGQFSSPYTKQVASLRRKGTLGRGVRFVSGGRIESNRRKH